MFVDITKKSLEDMNNSYREGRGGCSRGKAPKGLRHFPRVLARVVRASASQQQQSYLSALTVLSTAHGSSRLILTVTP